MPNSHPMFVHFPIVLLPLALLFWAIALGFRRDDLFRFGSWLLYLGVLSAALAVGTGLWAMERMGHHVPNHDAVHVHQNFMFATAALATGVAIATFLLRNRHGRRVRFALSAGLLATVTVLMLGADRGARLVYVFGIGTRKADPGEKMHDREEKHEHDKKPEIDHHEHEKHDGHGKKDPEPDGEKPTAESTFRRFEKKLSDAKSVTLNFESETDRNGNKTKRAGTVRFKPEHRFLLEAKFGEEKDRNYLLKSDGQRLTLRKGTEPAREQPFMKEMSLLLIAATARSGFALLEQVDREVAPDPEQMLKLSDFSIGEGDRMEVKVLLYTLTIQEKKAAVRLWIDTEKMIPVMREVKMEDLTISETYTGFSTDEIADDEFRHPSATGQKRYACPMNCATSDQAGKCPQCGMEMRELP